MGNTNYYTIGIIICIIIIEIMLNPSHNLNCMGNMTGVKC